MDIAADSKIPYTGHQKPGHASLRQSGGLTVSGIKSLYAKIHMRLQGNQPSTGVFSSFSYTLFMEF